MAEAALAVVLPAYNGCEALQRCLAALERHTPPEVCVRLVDDASTDPRVLPLLQAFARRRPGTTLRENAINGGFVASVNGELASTAGDVVLLNSDTEVTAGWIEGLLRCRDSSPAIGIVCPLSNNATLLSLQGLEVLFGGPGTDAIADCVRAAGPPSYPRIPTAVGFCMLVTRALLERAGPLDPAFGHGYGEENDLSMRATDLGFEIACCDDVYVRHAGAASFGTGRAQEASRERNRALLDRRWPRYEPQVSAWMRANPLRSIVERINAACERSRMPGRPSRAPRHARIRHRGRRRAAHARDHRGAARRRGVQRGRAERRPGRLVRLRGGAPASAPEGRGAEPGAARPRCAGARVPGECP
jgi:GT2 family glycosyltransferase